GRALEGGPGVPEGVGAPGSGPLPAEVFPGHEPHRAGVVAVTRSGHPQPPVPLPGRSARPDGWLVRHTLLLPGAVVGVRRSVRKLCHFRGWWEVVSLYLSVFAAYPFQTHSMACGRNCCWVLPTLWPEPRQNRY